ncbi:hypothetical protein VTJ04DRAFT_10430 [Mycothermus thermophilus]|uniref:uncharacterized protein n=1 Tax=Humicola insolens TaxID=85995 RepID=UPI0037433805
MSNDTKTCSVDGNVVTDRTMGCADNSMTTGRANSGQRGKLSDEQYVWAATLLSAKDLSDLVELGGVEMERRCAGRLIDNFHIDPVADRDTWVGVTIVQFLSDHELLVMIAAFRNELDTPWERSACGSFQGSLLSPYVIECVHRNEYLTILYDNT